MFNLDKAIRTWSRKLQATGHIEDGEAAELESHLRERIDDLVDKGQSPEEALNTAIGEIGQVGELADQYDRSHERSHWQMARKFLPSLYLNYLKVIARSFRRNRTHHWINVAGLVVGFTSCIFISYYTLFELSYDTAYRGKYIYRVINESLSTQGVLQQDAGGPVPLGVTLKEEFPEIRSVVRFWRAYQPTVGIGGTYYKEEKFMFTDPGAFETFSFHLEEGRAQSVFEGPNSIVISRSMARKYFHDEDPLGKILDYSGYPGGNLSFVVTGVFSDLPVNTHFSFDFLASMGILGTGPAGWGSFKPVWTYVELSHASDARRLEAKLDDFAKKYVSDRVANNKDFRFLLEPISSIHLHSLAERSMKAGGNLALLRVLILTGILILVMSCVNFINTALAKALTRLKEIGVRKVLGAYHSQVISQFVGEVVFSLLIAMVISAIAIYFLVPAFTSITGIPFRIQFLVTPRFLGVLIGIVVLVVILSGYLPALILAKYTVIDSLRQRIATVPGQHIDLKKLLTGFQYMISTALVVSILIVQDQLNFIRQMDIGVALDRIIAFPYSKSPDAFENRLNALNGVESIAYSQRLPVNTLNYDGRIVRIEGNPSPIEVQSCFIDPAFLRVYEAKLTAGRNFDERLRSDSDKFIINEAAMKQFGWSHANAVGQKLTWSESLEGEVIGVVRDFELGSAHEAVPPMVMLDATDKDAFERNYVSVKLDSRSQAETIAGISRIWHELNPTDAFYYVSMPESFESLYKPEQSFASVISYFSIVALFITAIGIYGSSSHSAERRRKEIGIRKVLGSTVSRITFKLSAPFISISLIAYLFITPLAAYLMQQWLETFAYHTGIKWTSLIVSGAVMLVLTVLSIARVTLGAALLNPVKFLRED